MLSAAFINCRGWLSREEDVKVLLGLKRFKRGGQEGIVGIEEV